MAYTRHQKTYPAKNNLKSWKPGQSGNPNGRPKGAKNKFTKELKNHIKKILGKHILNLDDDLAAMSPKDRVAAQTAWFKYFLNTTKETKNTVKGDIQIRVNYTDTKPLQIDADDIIAIDLPNDDED